MKRVDIFVPITIEPPADRTNVHVVYFLYQRARLGVFGNITAWVITSKWLMKRISGAFAGDPRDTNFYLCRVAKKLVIKINVSMLLIRNKAYFDQPYLNKILRYFLDRLGWIYTWTFCTNYKGPPLFWQHSHVARTKVEPLNIMLMHSEQSLTCS